MFRPSSLTSNPETLSETAASPQVHSLALTTALPAQVMSCDIELKGNRARRQAGADSMALKRTEE